jgi:hypothetical protein
MCHVRYKHGMIELVSVNLILNALAARYVMIYRTPRPLIT